MFVLCLSGFYHSTQPLENATAGASSFSDLSTPELELCAPVLRFYTSF